LRFGAERSWNGLGFFQLQGVGARDQGNWSGQPVSLGLLANWRAQF